MKKITKMRKEVYDVIKKYDDMELSFSDDTIFKGSSIMSKCVNCENIYIFDYGTLCSYDFFIYEESKGFFKKILKKIPKFTDEEMIFIFNSLKNKILNREKQKQEKLKNTLSKFNLTIEDFNSLKEALKN